MLVTERNTLIHTSLLSMMLDTVEGCLREVERLKALRERVKAEACLLLDLLRSFSQIASSYQDYMQGPQFRSDSKAARQP